ncbi:MAG TPA: hypothetical protein VJP79_07795, partial [Nitrososphaera sp.]|nr:hypothetical protein [Nitrososphaera sp.]
DCIVGIPSIALQHKVISYGPFSFEDSEFGQVAAVKLVVASISLLASKAIFRWVYQEYIKQWLEKKAKPLRARHIINTMLDILARHRIREAQGDAFYSDVIKSADALSTLLLSRPSGDYPYMVQAALASYMLGVTSQLPKQVRHIIDEFGSGIKKISSLATPLTRAVIDTLGNDISAKMGTKQLRWDELAAQCDLMYDAVSSVPGKWHNMYLPYSNLLDSKRSESIHVFQEAMVSETRFKAARRSFKGLRTPDDSMWQETFFEFVRELKFREKIMESLMQATRHVNFSNVLFPQCDYVSFTRMHADLSPDIRKISERVRMVKNAFDENTFQEVGSIDLQLAIQSIASNSNRSDIFTQDEELLKEETWSILVDSSKSLSGSSGELRAIAVCLAETAHAILGRSPWGMFAFSDELSCIKHYSEHYDNLIKARIGGLKMSGLSHIPDAIRACASLVKPYTKDHNFMILVSDGVPSGYSKIEQEFGASVKELNNRGINLIAMGVGSGSIKKTVRNARVVEKPSDIAKEFMEVYMTLSS